MILNSGSVKRSDRSVEQPGSTPAPPVVIPACLQQAGEGPPTGVYACMDASVDSSFRWNDNGGHYGHFVIPAKAGIQWFRQSIPACRRQAGMTTRAGYSIFKCRHPAKSQHPSNIPAPPAWIPASAGMTTGVGVGLSLSRQPLCYSLSITWLQPLPSFRRRPESSGLSNPFPRSGNDDLKG